MAPTRSKNKKRPSKTRKKKTPLKRAGSSAQPSRWVKCVLQEGNVRAVAIEATALISSMVKRHSLKEESATALGESVIGALLIASFCKQKERVNLNIQGSGLISQALIDAYADGTVRGYVIERKLKHVHIAENQGPWGGGLLSVLRTKSNKEQPYIGTVPLLTGHLAKDLTFYWYQSEQIPSAVGLCVSVKGNKVEAAAGFLIQAMPGANDAEVKQIQNHLQHLPNLYQVIRKNQDPVHLLAEVLSGSPFTLVEDQPLIFECQCSQERVERSLALVGAEELAAILREDGRAVVKCDFCSTDYAVEKDEIEKMLSRIQKTTQASAN